MLAWALVCLWIGMPIDDPDLAGMAKLLNAPKRADRQRAARAMLEAGAPALAVLAPLRDGHDLELRASAAALIDTIEAARLARPTLVRVSARNQPLAQVVADLEKTSGLPVLLQTQNNAQLAMKSITLELPEPVPFWAALDQLSRLGGLQIGQQQGGGIQFAPPIMVPGMPQQRVVRTGREIVLVADPTPPPPTYDSGAFRVEVVGLSLDRTRILTRLPQTGVGPDFAQKFEVRLQVRAEPRLTLTGIGEAVVDEATDDRGQSLLLPPGSAVSAGEPTEPRRGYAPNFGGTARTIQTPTLRLRYPDEPGRVLSRLNGRFTALVAGRRADPLEFALADARGRTFAKGGSAVTIDDLRPVEGGPGTIVELTIRTENGGSGGLQPGMNASPSDLRASLRPPLLGLPQLEFLDDQGRLCLELVTSQPGMAEGAKRTVMVPQLPGIGPPTLVRYHELAWGRVDIPFAFEDVPMP